MLVQGVMARDLNENQDQALAILQGLKVTRYQKWHYLLVLVLAME
jgi:hypothetical protein